MAAGGIPSPQVAGVERKAAWTSTSSVLGVQSLGDDAVMLRVATRLEPDHRRAFERALRERLKDAMDEADLEMPNRQLDVWLQRQTEAA